MTDERREQRAFDGRELRWKATPVGSASQAVITCVAAAEGCDPVDLPPLFDAVDPATIDALFPVDEPRGADRLSFRYCGYEIDLRPSVVRVRASE